MRAGKPSPQEVMQKWCEVCFVPFDRLTPKELDEGLQVLLCGQCHVTVHKCCYDFEPALTVLTQNLSQFLCEKCRLEPSKPPSCLVCYGTEGAMKPLQNSQDFIHVYCALVHNEIDILSYHPSLTFRKALHYEQLTNICEICMKRNAHDNCAEESCRRKVHTYCAKRTYVALAAESDEPHSWNHHISTGNHGNFDISDEVIPYELLSEEVDQLIKPVMDLDVDVQKLQTLKKKIHKEYTQELRSKRKTTKKLRRGGFSYVLCNQHESSSYCICQSKEQGSTMVQCECCFQWYHNQCIKDPATENEHYVCHFCKKFYQFKKRAVDEIRSGRTESEVGKVEMPLKISFGDCLWVIRVVDYRIRGGQAGKMLKELSKYPLKSSCMDQLIRQVSRSKLAELAEDVVREWSSSDLLQSLNSRVVLGLQASGRPCVLVQNVEYNKKLRRAMECLQGIVEIELGALKQALDFREKAVTDQYEQIIELCNIKQSYQEVNILKQKAQAYHYLQLANQLQKGSKVSFKILIQTQKKIKGNKDVPVYIVGLIASKIKELNPLVNKLKNVIRKEPENTTKIGALLQQLEEKHVQPIEEYQQLKIQRKFIMDLQLYYTKHEGVMQEDKNIGEMIELLVNWENIKSSQELIEIVNSYNAVIDEPIWKKTRQLVKLLRSATLEFQVKDILKRKVVKQDRLLELNVEDEKEALEGHSEEVKQFVNTWVVLKEKIELIQKIQLEVIENYEDIVGNLKIVLEVCQGLDQLGIKIEDQGKVSLINQLKIKKQELQQLQILLTEAQLPKNPLTINKLLPSLPKINPLVKQFFTLKKQHANLFNKYTTYLAKISERIQVFKSDTKKQRKDQIKQNNEKPSPSEVKELIQNIKQCPIDMDRELKELNRILNNSLEIANRVRKYCEQKSDFGKVKTNEELINRKKEIQELRKRVLTQAQLKLKSQLTDLYHMEITLRMKSALLMTNIQLEKIGFLLKVAEEQALTHEEMYIQLKDRYQTKNQKSKEVNQLRQLEQMLSTEASRDTTANLAGLTNYRRNLVLSNPEDIKIKNPYIEELIEKNKGLKTKIGNILMGKNKLQLQEVRLVYLEALKSPFPLGQLAKLTPQINKSYDILKKWKDLNKNYTISHPIFRDYQHSFFIIDEIQKVRVELRSNEQEISHLKFLVETFSAETVDQMEDIVDRMEINPVIKDTEVYFSGQLQYLQYWLKLIAHCRRNKEPVVFQKLRKLILDAYNLLQKLMKRGEDYQKLNPIIIEIESYLEKVKNNLKHFPKYSEHHVIVDGFIDLQDFYLDNQQEGDLTELIVLLRPFDDISKFRVKNLQRLEVRREDPNLKRSHSKIEELRGDSDKMIQLPLSSSSSSSSDEQQVPQVVSDNQRRKIKQIFLKNIRKNPQLIRYGECQTQVKMIENQIFGEWHNDIVKYFQMSDSFEKLFIKLITCPHISNKIIKKKFQFKFIQLLVTNYHKIDELEKMIIKKNQQEEEQKNMREIINAPIVPIEPVAQVETISEVVQFDETAHEDVKKEMRMIKESREGKEHKHKHKHKSSKHKHHRDRSRSPEAKFSSDSEKQLPNYIQKQYNRDEGKASKIELTARVSDSPLRYDPEEQQRLKKEIIYPKGSILKIKSCSAEIQTRRLGKIEFPINVMSEEEHRRIMEMVDPGFVKLSIHKYKNQAEMLPYINKSRKKYRFIVGWFQAINPQQNDLLRDLAEEAADKKKVFGWQNQHIKMHMMSVKQLATLQKFIPPMRVSTKEASEVLYDDRMVFVVQYPERLYEIRDQYKAFEAECIKEEYPVGLTLPIAEPIPNIGIYGGFKVPTIVNTQQNFSMQLNKDDGWPIEQSSIPPMPLPMLNQNQYGLSSGVNVIRSRLNFAAYSPIDTESDDNDEMKDEKEDLAAGLLDAFDVGKIAAPSAGSAEVDKGQQQPYQGYYQNYSASGYQGQQSQQQQQRPMGVDNRWMNYPPQMAHQGHQQTQQHQGHQPAQTQNVYNPLNPVAGKYQPGGVPPNPLQMPGMFKNNPLLGQRNPPPPMRQGQYYDPRYQGGYQHQQQ